MVAGNLGLQLQVLMTDGRQPIGRGIGPALEARDILAVLQNKPNAPLDLRDRAVEIAGAMLEMVAAVEPGQGQIRARQTVESGAAWEKFRAICEAQGGLRVPPVAPYRYALVAPHDCTVLDVDNRQLAKIAKLAGAPADPAAGIELHVKIGDRVEQYQSLLTIHAENAGELNYAVDYLTNHELVLTLSQPPEEEAL